MTCETCKFAKSYDQTKVNVLEKNISFCDKIIADIREEWKEWESRPSSLFSYKGLPPSSSTLPWIMERANCEKEIDRIKNNYSCQRYPEAVNVKKDYECGEYQMSSYLDVLNESVNPIYQKAEAQALNSILKENN